MINFNGLRGSGKTVKLVKTAYLDYKLGYRPVIVTIQKDMEEIYRNAGLPNEIPVITYNEYLKNPSDYMDASIFIDETEIFLQRVCYREGYLLLQQVILPKLQHPPKPKDLGLSSQHHLHL